MTKRNKALRLPLALAALALILLLALAGCNKPAGKPLEITGVFPAAGAEAVPSDAAVELTFTVPPAALDGYFTVEPAVKGRFQYMDNKVAFIPSGGSGWDGEAPGEWQSETAYTVTVKAGLPAKEGKGTLAEDYTFTFTAQKEDALLYQMVNPYETFLPEDYPVLDLARRSYWGEERPPAEGSFEISVYRLESGEQYRDELYKAASYGGEPRVDTAAMTPVLAFTQSVSELTAIAEEDQDRGDRFLDIIFPQALEEGWYVASVTPGWGNRQPIQKLLQIQPTAVYTQNGPRELLLWLNDTASGKAVSGARLEIYQDPFSGRQPDFTVQGSSDGILTFDTTQLGKREDWAAKGRYESAFLLYSLTTPEGRAYYDVLTSHYWGDSESVWQQYYGFLYTDRPIYHPSDTVKYWGVVKPRKDAPPASSVQVELTHNWGAEPVAEDEVAVSPDGVFTGELSYQDLAGGELNLDVYLPSDSGGEGYGRSIDSVNVGIAQYKKPIYTAGIETDKLYYRPGETVNARVEVSLFDRTPASGMKMNLSAAGSDPQEFTTGEDGLIRTSYLASVTDDHPRSGWRPRPFVITGSNGDASDVDLSVREEVYVFPSTLMMEAESKKEGDSSSLTVSLNRIDFDKLPGGRQVIQDYETLRGAPAQAKVQVGIHKVSYTRVELPPYYDRYTKTSVPRYSYQRSEELVDHITRSTGADGRLTLTGLPVSSHRGGDIAYYYAEINLYEGGAQQQVTLGLGNPWYAEPNDRGGHFHTFQVDTSMSRQGDSYSYYYAIYRFGDEARFQVRDNGIPLEEGTVMTNLMQNGSLRAPVLSGPSGSFTCDEDTLPNFYLCGAYFDGRRIYPIYPISMEVTPDSRQLNLQVLPEKEDYQPGDTAGITLKLTGQDGKPVSGGNVCLGVVDEAIFAVREQYVNMGSTLYRQVYWNFPHVLASYVQHGVNVYYDEGGKGGGGGGGGVTIRENFQDTAAFLTGKTGADGTVSFRVALPDDLTQWRLTAVALDSRAYWGETRSQLYTSLPFRIDPILSTSFLSGDTIACTVRGFGTGITSGDTVEYTASIEGYSQPLEVTASAPAGETTPLVFQKLPAGEYAMTVTARCGAYSDGVKKTFTVRDSALTFPIHRTVDLAQSGLAGIQPARWPAELTLYHRGQKPFMDAWRLIWLDNSLRADTRLATAAVRPAVTAFFGEDYPYPEADTSGIQVTWEDEREDTGALCPYSYAEGEIRLSARAAVAVPELIDRDLLGYYLTAAETADPTDQAAALMGAAALGYLGDDQRLLLETRARNGGAAALEDAYLIAGLSYLDLPAAQRYYAQRIVPLYKEENGGLYLPANTGYDTVEQTAGALTCAILTGAVEDAEKLLDYLTSNAITAYGTIKGPCQLEAALFIQRFHLAEEELPAVTYTRDGKEQTVTLPASSSLRMSLTREEWAALNLSGEPGAIAEVSYTGDPDQLNFTPSPRVTVTKTMDTPEDQKHLGGETTVTIKVELDPAMPYGQYQLVEWIPSNMRLRSVLQPEEENAVPFSYRLDEQLLTVDFYRNKKSGSTFTLTYTATSVLDTECTLERSYAYCSETMEGGRTEKGEFLPSDYYYLGVGYLFRRE